MAIYTDHGKPVHVISKVTIRQARGDIALGLIQVYRALGGGWELRLADQAADGRACQAAPETPPPATMPPAAASSAPAEDTAAEVGAATAPKRGDGGTASSSRERTQVP